MFAISQHICVIFVNCRALFHCLSSFGQARMIVDDGFIKKNSFLPSGLAWAKTDMNSIEKTVLYNLF